MNLLISEAGPLSSVDDNPIPTPGKPSLKMRLFRAGENQKKMLISMFNDKENKSWNITCLTVLVIVNLHQCLSDQSDLSSRYVFIICLMEIFQIFLNLLSFDLQISENLSFLKYSYYI